MTVKERFIKIIIDRYSSNKREFALAIGVNPTVVENIVGSRGGNPSFETLQKTLFANADINCEWLILDIEPAYKSEKTEFDKKTVEKEVETTKESIDLKSFELFFIRYDSLAHENGMLKDENALLKNKVEELEKAVEKLPKKATYKIPKSGSSIAAEPKP